MRARKSKFVCINDDLKWKTAEMDSAIHEFYESFFPIPSQFEKRRAHWKRNLESWFHQWIHSDSAKTVSDGLLLFCCTLLTVMILKWALECVDKR